MVLNRETLATLDHAAVFSELAALRESAPHPTLLKLILETSQLSRREVVAACTLAAAAHFDFVKTSTGFVGHGAREQDVRLMAACCGRLAVGQGSRMRVKASGGVRTLRDAVAMLEAGAARLGTSAGVWIAREAKEVGGQVLDGKGERPAMATRLFSDY